MRVNYWYLGCSGEGCECEGYECERCGCCSCDSCGMRVVVGVKAVGACCNPSLNIAIPHITKRKTDSGQKSGYYTAILSGKEDHSPEVYGA